MRLKLRAGSDGTTDQSTHEPTSKPTDGWTHPLRVVSHNQPTDGRTHPLRVVAHKQRKKLCTVPTCRNSDASVRRWEFSYFSLRRQNSQIGNQFCRQVSKTLSEPQTRPATDGRMDRILSFAQSIRTGKVTFTLCFLLLFCVLTFFTLREHQRFFSNIFQRFLKDYSKTFHRFFNDFCNLAPLKFAPQLVTFQNETGTATLAWSKVVTVT